MAIKVNSLCPLIQVFDMPASLRFYRDILGFEIVDSAPAEKGDQCDWAWIRLNETNLMLNTAYESPSRPPKPDGTRIKAHADTVLYFECPEIDKAHEHLVAHGLDVAAPSVAPYGMRQLSVIDPDGFALCFQWPAE